MKKILLITSLLVSTLAFSQDTYQYKGYGQNAIYKFTDSTLTINNKGDITETPIKIISKTEKVSIYAMTEPYMGVITKFSLVKKGKKGKYYMFMDNVDDFTKIVTKLHLIVNKI